MNDESSNSLKSDALTDLLKGLRLDGLEYGRRQLDGEWAFTFPQKTHAYFHFIGGQACWIRSPAGEWLKLNAGDAILLPHGDAHALASSPEGDPAAYPVWQCRPLHVDTYEPTVLENGSGHVLFYGSMRFNLDRCHPLMSVMPDVLQARTLMRDEPATLHLLDAMACEMSMARVGAFGIVTRLADVLAAQIIRSWVEHGCGDAAGWIAAVRHPQIGRVLAAIHADPGRCWSLESLAEVMGGSRSSFAAKFASVVGKTPAKYIVETRMHQARHWFTMDKTPISKVAERLGYESEASFSRSFKKVIGLPPSHYRMTNTKS